MEMYLAGVSVRRVEDITEALWGTRVSPATVSDLNKRIYGTIEGWRNRPIEGEHPMAAKAPLLDIPRTKVLHMKHNESDSCFIVEEKSITRTGSQFIWRTSAHFSSGRGQSG
jgi:Transposase, Mutator family